MKVVINKCYGGFGLSREALREYAKLKGKELWFYRANPANFKEMVIDNGCNEKTIFSTAFDKNFGETMSEETTSEAYKQNYFSNFDISRDDKDLIEVVEKLGSKRSSGSCSCLQVVEIPDGVEYEITDYDGIETLHEKHRSW
jgi:hypothetical protein